MTSPAPSTAATMPALLDAQAAARPDALALSARSVSGERLRLSYAPLATVSRRAAGALAAEGVRAGDRVAVILGNDAGYECIAVATGALRLGAAIVPMNPRWSDPELVHALALSEPALVVTDATGRDRLATLAPALAARSVEGGDGFPSRDATPVAGEASADDLASLLFTSGTTARSKAVMHSHATTLAAGRACAAALGLRPDDVYQGAFPFFTSSALNIACAACWTTGAGFAMEHVVGNAERLALVAAEGTTFYHGVPAVLRYMADEHAARPADLAGIRRLASGGAPLPPESRARFSRMCPGATFVQIYGSTESGPAGTVADASEMDRHPTAVGRPMPGYRVRTVDETGADVPAGECGEVVLEGPGVALGYWRDPEATAAAFRGRSVRLGDVGRLVERDLLLFEDRAKDRINRGGLKISSAAVEAALLEHPAVSEAAVVGARHPALGEDVAAFVVLRPREVATVEDLRTFLTERLAPYEIPRVWRFVDALPRNPMGKVLKSDLRGRLG